MSGINYMTGKEGLEVEVRGLKIDKDNPENSGFDFHRLYNTLPNGEPTPEGYEKKLPYPSLA